jgi:small conductance mechanosensitive channel
MDEVSFDTEKLSALMEKALGQFLTGAMDFAGAFLAAIVLVVIGFVAAAWIGRSLRKLLDRARKIDPTLKPFLVSIARYTVLTITFVTVLGVFGVPMASLIAFLGAAGLAVGLALQGTLSNVAAGVMLLALRPFKIGDFVEVAGQSGTVRQIGLFTTELTTLDNLFVSLPNSGVWGAVIINYNRMPTRRLALTVGIDYGDDIDRALDVARSVLNEDTRVLADPAPQLGVKALGESSVDLFIYAHTATPDWWPTLCDLQKNLKKRFDDAGLSIPFPQRMVHVRHMDSSRN